MARTPVLRQLQRLFRDFGAEEREEQGHAVVARRPGDLTRRDLLRNASVVALGTALAGPIRALAASTPRIAIVGGGIAGLNAALTLQDAGFASTVFEASSRVGGRMHSDTTSWANGQVSEHCGE